MICSLCLKIWQDHNIITKTTCPFCRCEIKAFEPVIISPFEYHVEYNVASESYSDINFRDDTLDSSPETSNPLEFGYLNISSQPAAFASNTENDSQSSNSVLEKNNGYESITCNSSHSQPSSEVVASSKSEGNSTLSETSIPSVSNLIQLYESSCKSNSAKILNITRENENIGNIKVNSIFRDKSFIKNIKRILYDTEHIFNYSKISTK